MKDKNFRNMVNDPYLYRDCCGGAMLGADGEPSVYYPPQYMTAKVALVSIALSALLVFAYKRLKK